MRYDYLIEVQILMTVPSAIMEDASKTVTTQMDPTTALATLDGCYQAMAKPAQVEIKINYEEKLICT